MYLKEIKEKRLLTDRDIASLLSVSRSWVRKQRFNRRHGLPHVLIIDPVMVGCLPRYRVQDVEAWLASLTSENEITNQDMA